MIRLIGIIVLCGTLVACGGVKYTKVDLTEQQMTEIRRYYPNAVSGYILIQTSPKDTTGDTPATIEE